jgi:uncharacterized protein YcbK (DUF882 family)
MRAHALALALATAAISTAAHADVQHVVARGHTIEAIANRYHVSAKAILDANHITNARHLHPGDVLTIPTKAGDAKDSKETKDAKDAAAHAKAKVADAHGGKKSDKTAKLEKTSSRQTTNYAMKAKTPGVVHVKRIATNEEYDIHIAGRGTHVSPAALKTLEKMMRSPSGMAHPIEPRLARLLAVVSNHFGSRKIEVVSGFRPFTPTQYNPHSNHMHGKAIDFRVVGVPNEAVRDFCRTLKNVGCGYYPNSVFVHMDARDQSTFWIDYSKPGETPRYNAPDLDADEGTSDVHDDGQLTTAPAATTPGDAAEPAKDAPTAAPTAVPATNAPAATSVPVATPTPAQAVPAPVPAKVEPAGDHTTAN